MLLVFVDGLGIGPEDPSVNPMARFDGDVLNFFLGRETACRRDGICIPTDACLGVPGLPQSATGQTTLFTGENAARLLGYHLQGFPNRLLRDRLAQRSLFKLLLEAGRRATFANVYTPSFFIKRSKRVSVTTSMCQSSGLELRTLKDLHQDRGLFMDITNQWLRDEGLDVPIRTVRDAAEILSGLTKTHDLVLYEYFMTDLVGHRGRLEEAEELGRKLDQFLSSLLAAIDLDRVSVLVCSDHGNFEDLRTRTHTRNPVPTLAWGGIRHRLEAVSSLDSIAPAVVGYLTGSD